MNKITIVDYSKGIARRNIPIDHKNFETVKAKEKGLRVRYNEKEKLLIITK